MFARHKPTHWGARVAVAGLAAGVAALAGSASAIAKDDSSVTTKSATAPHHLPAGDATIQRGDRVANLQTTHGDTAPVVHFYLKYSSGESFTAYCIDFNHHARKTGHSYTPGTWDASNVNHLPQVQWILSHSNADKPAGVLKAAGVDASGLQGKAKEFIAYVGTQTAIWHYSDGIDIRGHGDTLTDAGYEAAMKVRGYLVDHAKKAPEPTAPSLSISPAQGTGHVGDRVGPFTVTTKGGVHDLKLTASGDAQVVDESGKALGNVGNGDKFWVEGDSTGKVAVTAKASGTIPTGQVYTAPKPQQDKFQKLILADTAPRTVGDTAAVTLTAAATTSPSASASPSSSPSPSSAPASPSASGTAAGGGLPVTGTSLPMIIGAALVLLVAGGAAVLFARRRRATH